MGRSFRERPKHLGRKLALIRKRLGLTQPELIERLKVMDKSIYPSSITLYEQGRREPPLLILMRYARLYGCTMEELADDRMKLPAQK